MSIEERIAKILTAHFWIEHRMECACGDNAGKPAWEYDAPDYVAHVARVLTTELRLDRLEAARKAFVALTDAWSHLRMDTEKDQQLHDRLVEISRRAAALAQLGEGN